MQRLRVDVTKLRSPRSRSSYAETFVRGVIFVQTDCEPWHAWQRVAYLEPDAAVRVISDIAKTNQAAHVDTDVGIDWGSEAKDPLFSSPAPARQPDQETRVKGFWMQACFPFRSKVADTNRSLIFKRAALHPCVTRSRLAGPGGSQPAVL